MTASAVWWTIEAMGDLGSVIRVSAGGRDRLNAMYMVDGYGENNPIVVKSEFIMSLIEQIDKKGVGPQHKSIIDRCITNVYQLMTTRPGEGKFARGRD